MCTDLSQLKRLTMLEDINHYRNSMVHSISHELKTPLNGMVNLVQSMYNLASVDQELKDKYLEPHLNCASLMI